MNDQRQAADEAYRQGRFPEAEAGYLRVLEAAPADAALLERLGNLALWHNRAQQAEDYLLRALHSTTMWRRLWPFNAELKSRLALTYYRMDRFADAARLFDEAAGPIALGPFRELSSYARTLRLFDDVIPYALEGPDESEVPFLITDPLPVIEVAVNGSSPLPFVIDTGGAELILDNEFAQQVGAVLAATASGQGAGPTGRYGLGRVDAVHIGEFTLRNVPIHTLDTRPLAAALGGQKVQGIVGTRTLMHFLATIDYPGQRLVLRRPSSPQQETLAHAATATGGAAIPFWLVEMHMMLARGSVNDLEPTPLFVDTGLAGGGFTASETTLRAAGVNVDWTQAREGPGAFGMVEATPVVVDRITLGDGANTVTEHDVAGVAIRQLPSIFSSKDKLGFRIGGLISHAFFRRYALTFDFTTMRLYVQPSAASQIIYAPRSTAP